ncbi:MAG: UDP-N-acetylmuramoyl-tripeptide--D-alanyl-D-alanine ligase [Planctomycetota bacterium]|jgi:UDP-N-acetylmuramoyl-tripeptide--D-alanyl-D-alanine ligase
MSFWTPDNLCHQSGGRWLQAPARNGLLGGVGIDTRQDLAGRVFVAIRGETHDGHDYLKQAADAGAALLIVEKRPGRRTLRRNVGVIQVDDTRRALRHLAAAYRQRLSGTTVIAVTGSVGKTTVKMLIDRVLSTTLRGSAAPKSFNNDIGVPLTILAAAPQDEYVVVEIGANAPGEIGRLSNIARPNIGVITMAGRAHLQGFATAETVVDEKAQLLRHLESHRIRRLAVVNADVPRLRTHCHVTETVMLFGEADDADLRLTGWGAENGSWWFEVNGEQRFRLGLPGRHNAVNALAAVAVARRLWVDDGCIDEALAGCRPVDMRMTCDRINGVTIYNDAYNANPESVIAALATFAQLAADAPRRIIVLGDMAELGDASDQLHEEIGRHVVELDRRLPIDRVVLVGPLSARTAAAIEQAWGRNRLIRLPAMDAPGGAAVARLLEPNDAVLLKGSRVIGLERLIQAIGDGTTPVAAASP